MTTTMDITGESPDDLLYNVALTYQGSPLNLATVTSITAYLKTNATASDATAKTYTVGGGLTITSSPGGLLTWFIPNSDVGLNRWYRISVVDTSNHKFTALKGRLDLEDA